jgi:subtilisin-like proprotein convertase family protein
MLLTGAHTAGATTRPPGRFDDLVKQRVGGAVVVAPRAIESLDDDDELRVAWEDFGDLHGGGWSVYLDERTGIPTLVSGRGIEWLSEEDLPGASLEDLEARARSFLSENREMLGDPSGTMELDRRASFKARNGHWQLVLRQLVDGVRVEDSRLAFHLKHGRLVMLGASHWGRPTASGIPSLDAGKARAALDGYLGVPSLRFEPSGEPELAMIVLDADPAAGEPAAWTGPRGEGLRHALIWRFRFREPGAPASWIGEVDAHDGSIRAFYDGTQYSSVRGGVFPISGDGDCSAGGCEIAGFPMPFADYTEAGQPEEAADAYGNLMCSDPMASFETNLSGPYVNVSDACGAASEFGTCDEGLDLGLKHGENCDVGPGASAGNTSAARTTFYHINRIAEVARFYDPGNTWLESSLTVNVNGSGSCNANWDGAEINMYGAGGFCRNTGENSGILVHEWGHGYDHNDGGGMDRPGEAYADIVAIITSRDSCMGRGMYNDGRTCTGYGDTCLTCTGFRDFDWAARQLNTPATPTGFAQPYCPADYTQYRGPCRREAHCESYISSEAMYDLATRDLPAAGMDLDSAWQLVERLWYETRPGSGGDAYRCLLPSISDSCDANNWYQKMRVADDDDGDLANGTPHAAALYAAFARHHIACGAAGNPENQSTSSCPSLAAPVLIVSETPSGTELSWNAVTGAAEYRVYRGELGCHRQQVAISSLTGGQTAYVDSVADPDLSRYYRIEAFGSNPACHSPVSNCEATPLGARLQKQAHRVVDDGDGIPEPGETLQLPVTLLNTGVEHAVAIGGELQLVGPAHVRLLNAEATWPDLAPGAASEADDPQFELVLLEAASCGEVLTLDLSAWAGNAAPIGSSMLIPMGDRNRAFLQDQTLIIPYYATAPVTSTIAVTHDQTLGDLDVSVNISHDDATQLIVELSSPEGTTVRLHDHSAPIGDGIVTRYDLDSTPDGPGTMGDFAGESTLGTWTLSIEDSVDDGSTEHGSLHDWTLHMTVAGGFDCDPATCPEPTPTEAPELTVDTAVNGSEIDLVLTWAPVAGAAGHHVLQSTSPAFDIGVELLERATTETTHTIADGVNTTPALTFFQVRATNACHQEGP